MNTLDQGATSKPGQPRPRVLAIDDQRDAGRLLQLQLRSAGIDCFVCYDGPSALRFVAEQKIDVIILDVMMPEMDGYEVCRRLKADERTRDIPILFLTAKVETQDKVHALGLGGHDYLVKPVQHQELLARTRAALRVKYLQDQLKEKLALEKEVNRLHQSMLGQHWQNMLGQLASSLAHEINNPLAIALGSVQLLTLENETAPEVRQRLQAVDESLQRAARKLRSLLLIAHTDQQARRVELAQLVEDVLALTHVEVLMNGVTVRTQLDRTCSWMGIAGELARAVLALINNALEAVHGQANPAILVEVRSSGSQELIRIANNGPGIPEESRERIFERFFTTKAAPHHGLGLGLARQIVQGAGGTIEFQPRGELGGAEFTIALPGRVA